MPREWLGPGDEAELEAVLEQLFRARLHIRHRVEDLLCSEAALFLRGPGESFGHTTSGLGRQ